MPVNSVCETKKSIEKTKFSLSLNKNNASYLSSGIRQADSKEHPLNSKLSNGKENRPLKRPLSNTYSNTLNAAKRLKPLAESPRPAEKENIFEPLPKTYSNTLNAVKRLKPLTESPRSAEKIFEPEVVLLEELHSAAMLNGHPSDGQYGGSAPRKTPIATLSNLGNTCFLNSVLYTLRYAPRFLHNLHHLVSDLASVEQKVGSIRLKSSSLGRSAAGLANTGARSWSSKDLLSLGQGDNSTGKSKIQIVTEKLHETYVSMRRAESKGVGDTAPEPVAAEAFLAALREVNSTFEGNRQQDAHELLVCILDNIRETCRALSLRASRLQLQENGESNGIGRSVDVDAGKATLTGLRKSWKKRKEGKENKERRVSPDEGAPELAQNQPGWDFVAEDFEGTMVVRTTCLECEAVTEKRQAVCELCVPVDEELGPADEPFRAACLAAECLRDQNKYWCEQCLRYNEARRTVSYARLPRLLVLQLKRFSGGMEKITRHAPTPKRMPCFCEPCVATVPKDHHSYSLWAVIMHLGQTLTGGHYVAYARERDSSTTELKCEREGSGDATAPNSGSSFMRTLFNRGRQPAAGCLARECCAPRPRSPTAPSAPAAGPAWLHCDDDIVKPLTDEEFDDLLSPDSKMRAAATPYLLFYVKNDVG